MKRKLVAIYKRMNGKSSRALILWYDPIERWAGLEKVPAKKS